MQVLFDLARTAIALVFMLYASWSDLKIREVSNNVWIFFAPPVVTLTLVELVLYEPSQLTLYGVCVALTSALAVILFYSGGFGGADAKAFMCLALALPFYPAGLFTPVLGEVSPISRIFFPIAVFSNSVLFAALTAVAILLYNMLERVRTGKTLFEGEQGKESIGKKILILITGYKVSVNVLKAKWHVYPLEDIEEEADDKIKRKLIVLPKDEGRDQIVERLQRAADSGKIQNRVWASPGLPMLVFVTAGLIVALFLGDVIWTLVRLVLG